MDAEFIIIYNNTKTFVRKPQLDEKSQFFEEYSTNLSCVTLVPRYSGIFVYTLPI